jgi:predicted nucleic acid-binding protein
MICRDSDVMVDLLRQYPPATNWFDALDEDQKVVLPGYVVMELLQGCKNRAEQDRLQTTQPYDKTS